MPPCTYSNEGSSRMTMTTTEVSRTSRNFRALDPLWEAAKLKAAAEGDKLSDVLNRALEAYVAEGSPEATAEVTVRFVLRGSRVVAIEQG